MDSITHIREELKKAKQPRLPSMMVGGVLTGRPGERGNHDANAKENWRRQLNSIKFMAKAEKYVEQLLELVGPVYDAKCEDLDSSKRTCPEFYGGGVDFELWCKPCKVRQLSKDQFTDSDAFDPDTSLEESL